MKVYLAGPISGLPYHGAQGWREYAEAWLSEHGITPLNPLRHKNYLKHETRIKDFYEHTLSTSSAIVARDRFDVSRCDMMLVNFSGAERVSIGTCVEYGWANAYEKPICTVIDSLHEHVFINELSGWVVGSLDEGLDVVKHVLL